MRFKVTMVNDLGKFHEETIIANNLNEAKINVMSLNPRSNLVDAKWVYK